MDQNNNLPGCWQQELLEQPGRLSTNMLYFGTLTPLTNKEDPNAPFAEALEDR